MRFAKLAIVMSLCALAWAQETNDDLVASAIKESSEKYKAKMLEATILGAQSKVRGAKSTPFADKVGEISTIFSSALDILTTRHNMDKQEALKLLAKQAPGECQADTLTCNAESKYRTIDGTCNHLEATQQRWGAANIQFKRLARADSSELVEYVGNNQPRGGIISTLPNARDISLQIHNYTADKPDSSITHMVPQFGQFLDHDITLTPEGGLGCCGMAEENRPEECFVIKIAPDDPFYSINRTVTCLDFTRSIPFCPTQTNAIRQQMNAITAFIDGSQVYGSDKHIMKQLREFDGGRLEENSVHKGFLPWTSDVDPAVKTPGRTKAGDVRSDEMPGLAVMHTLFHREHNRIAADFTRNTAWTNEQIFQETRRIIIAELQQVAYNEFLPVILGPELMEKYKLTLPAQSAFTTYNPMVDPSIFNSFAVAAYRFGHTMVNGLIKFLINGSLEGGYHVREHYFNSEPIVNETRGYDKILGGLISQASQSYDGEFSEDLTNYLFRNRANNYGSDLAARNIQRGRDHGTPGYNVFRQYCELPALTNFETPPSNINAQDWEKLKNVYVGGVSDIDLYTGALVEDVVSGGQSGATFACLMGIQFQNLKDGDRFFFTHSGQSGSFSQPQLQALRKRTLGDIICDNSDLEETSSNVFKIETNKVKCTEASRKLDLSLFYPEKPDTSGASSVQLINLTYIIMFALFSTFYTLF